MSLTWIIAFVGVVLAGLQAPARSSDVRFSRVYPLKASEGVFAYARISPNGQFLAYASEMPDPVRPRAITQTVTVVDLRTGQTLFTEPGIDAYWSNDGERMIFLAQGQNGGVTIRHHATGALVRNVAPRGLGDYFSWGVRDGKNLILTIQSNYYFLDGDTAVLPASRVVGCEGIGTGDRPLVSKDGRRATTFVRGEVVVRNLTDCEQIIRTGLQGAKADFSFDGRYVAFHVAKKDVKGYEIVVVDLDDRSVRTVTNLPGSSLFPSWTKDGRLCFRYDGDDYRGFMMADNVLAARPAPLPAPGPRLPAAPQWADLFPETPLPAERLTLVMIWATWSAHSPYALESLQSARRQFHQQQADVGVMTAVEPASRRADVDRLRRQSAITLPEIPLAPARLTHTEALNQIPTTLLFKNGVLVDRRLGAQSTEELRAWVAGR